MWIHWNRSWRRSAADASSWSRKSMKPWDPGGLLKTSIYLISWPDWDWLKALGELTENLVLMFFFRLLTDLKTHLLRHLKPHPLLHLLESVQVSCTHSLPVDVLCLADLGFSSLFSHPSDKQKDTLSSSFLKWLYDRFGVYIEDFRFQPEETTVETEEPLSAKRWGGLWRISRTLLHIAELCVMLSSFCLMSHFLNLCWQMFYHIEFKQLNILSHE